MNRKHASCIVLSILMFILFSGCASNQKSIHAIDLNYFKESAKIGMTEAELKETFGQEPIIDYVDNSEVWLFDRTRPDYKYKPDLNKVEHDDIKKGNIEYQLFIIMKEKKSYMFSYFYKGPNHEVWEYVLNPDGTIINIQVSR